MKGLNLAFIIGTAGSGKTELTASLTRWLELQGEDVLAVNLDPGAIIVPYPANVDVRDYITVEEVMERYGLGPNGGLVYACDMMISIIDKLAREIESFDPDLVILDTPGQMELFAFRDIGVKIAEGLSDEPKGIIYLFDATYCRNPLNYVMNMFIASAIANRFLLPLIPILSKADLLGEAELEEIQRWSEDPALLQEAVGREVSEMDRVISQDMMEIINRLGMEFSPIPVSSKTYMGFTELYAELSRVFVEGERFTQ
ncbi:hypothetical protein CW701_00185 [Candidatus Bathyarchaeota archaeon]|nr:MAG: hypothetical protein CW701_00185 [Candidatus Bathyarchaeota archaeon]